MERIFNMSTQDFSYHIIGKDADDSAHMGFGAARKPKNAIDPAIANQYLKINDQKGSFPGYGGLPVWYQPANLATKELLSPDAKITADTREILQKVVHQEENNGYYYIDQSTVNSMIVGVTRSGKGQKIILPLLSNLARGEKKPTVIIHDPKGELLRDSGSFFKANGYKIYNFNPSDSTSSSHWNIFETAYQAIVAENKDSFDEAVKEMVDIFVPEESIANEKYWNLAARTACEALLRYFLITNTYQTVEDSPSCYHLTLAKKPPVYRDFIAFVTDCVTLSNNRQLEVDEKLELACMLKHYDDARSLSTTYDYQGKIEPILTTPEACLLLCQDNEESGLNPRSTFWYQQIASAQELWMNTLPSADRTRSCILSCMTGPMGQLESSSLFEITSDNEINFPDLLKEPSVVYLQSSVRAPQLNGFLTLFINRFHNYVFDQDRQTQQPGDHRRVHFVIDELPLLSKIPNLSGKLASGLGSQLLFDLAIQDIDQLKSRYDQEADSILANCSNLMFIAGDGATIDYLVKRSAGLLTQEDLTYKADNTVYLFRSLVPQKMLGHNQASLPICCQTMPFYFMIASTKPFTLPKKEEKKRPTSLEYLTDYKEEKEEKKKITVRIPGNPVADDSLYDVTSDDLPF